MEPNQGKIIGDDGYVYNVTNTGIGRSNFTADQFYQTNPDYKQRFGEIPVYSASQIDTLWKSMLDFGADKYGDFGNDYSGQTFHNTDLAGITSYLGYAPTGKGSPVNPSASGTYIWNRPEESSTSSTSSPYPALGQIVGDLFTNPHTGTTYNWRTGAIVYDPEGKGAALLPAQPTTTAGGVTTLGGLNMPTINYGTGNIGGAVAGASGVSSYIDIQQQIAADRQKQIEAQQKALQTATAPFLQRLLGSDSPMEAREDAWDATGMNPASYFADQRQKIAEIETLTQEYNATKAAMEQQIAQSYDAMASNNFINNQQAQITRNAAPKLNMLSANINSKAATLQALQGNFNEAQNFVNQAVSDATAEFKYNYDVFTTFYEMNQDILTALDEPYKQAYEAKLDLVKVQYEQAVDEANAVAELMMDNPKAGITTTDTFASAAQKVARSGGSLSYQQEQRLLANSGSGGTKVEQDLREDIVSYLDDGVEEADIVRRLGILYPEYSTSEIQNMVSAVSSNPEAATTTTTTSAPRTAYSTGQAITSSPYYQAFSPDNLYAGAKSVVSNIGNFFKGLAGF